MRDQDPDPESDFQLVGDSRSEFGSSKNLNPNTFTSVKNPALDPNPEEDFQLFSDSTPRLASSKKMES